MKNQYRLGSMTRPLIGSPSFAVATYVGAILLACDRVFFEGRDADPAKEAAHHRRCRL